MRIGPPGVWPRVVPLKAAGVAFGCAREGVEPRVGVCTQVGMGHRLSAVAMQRLTCKVEVEYSLVQSIFILLKCMSRTFLYAPVD
jgi:hypothetical protein